MCETPAEGFHLKWRRICGRNPAIHKTHTMILPFLSEFNPYPANVENMVSS